MMPAGQKKSRIIADNQRNMFNFLVIIVPADGLAPLGAKASADTVIVKFGSHVLMKLALKRSKL